MKKRILYLGNKLSKHGNTTTVIETLGASLTQEGYAVVYASDKKNQLLRLLDMIFTTIKYVSKVDFVLIDTYSTVSFNYALITSQICRFFNKKYIPILHGGNLPNRLERNPYLCRLVFKNAHVNVAPSHYLLNAFSNHGYRNLVFIPNTIEIDKYSFHARDFETPKLLWVRSFASIYNPMMAIEVASKIQKHYPESILCMVGPDKENLVEQCQHYANSLHTNVLFTGKLSKEQWIELSKEYNVFINTTHFDNTPVSVIEAMALGLPIVSTNVGGIPYLLNDTSDALLVSDGDSEQMFVAIERLFKDSTLRNALILNARTKAESFDWKQVRQKWFEILN